MRDEELIRSLSADLQPKASLRSAQNALLLWLLGSFAVLLASLLFLKIRPDISKMLETVSFHLELFSALAVGIVAAGTALHLRIPGARPARKVLAAFVLIWLSSLVLHGYSIPHESFQWRLAWHCFVCIVGLSVLPGILLYGLVRRGASTEPKTTLAVVGIAMTATAAAFLPLACGNDTIPHLIFGHGSPLFILGLSFWFIGKPLLKW